MLIRYANDLAALCHFRQEALGARNVASRASTSRGLAFNEDRMGVSSPSMRASAFLGFNVHRYGNKPLITPSKSAVRRIRERLRTELRSVRGTNAPSVIRRLNPIIRGWAVHYRTQVSAGTFGELDQWSSPKKRATFTHANKPTSWVVARYFVNTARQDRWVFGCFVSIEATGCCPFAPQPPCRGRRSGTWANSAACLRVSERQACRRELDHR